MADNMTYFFKKPSLEIGGELDEKAVVCCSLYIVETANTVPKNLSILAAISTKINKDRAQVLHALIYGNICQGMS